MVKHLVMWKLKEEMEDSEKKEIKQAIKRELEALKEEIEGVLSLRVITEILPTSNMDVMLESAFKDATALRYYAEHPSHVKVAEERVKPFVSARSCFDYEE